MGLVVEFQRVVFAPSLSVLGGLAWVDDEEAEFAVLAEELRDAVHFVAVGDGVSAGHDDCEEVLVGEFVFESVVLVPEFDCGAFEYVAELAECLECGAGGVEYELHFGLDGEVSDSVEPDAESEFFFCSERDVDDYAAHFFEYVAGSEYHEVSFGGVFDEGVDCGAEECVDEVCFLVDSDYYVADVVFFGGFGHAVGDVDVVFDDAFEWCVGFGGNDFCFEEVALSVEAVVFGADYFEGVEVVFDFAAFDEAAEFDEALHCLWVSDGDHDAFDAYFVVCVCVADFLGCDFACCAVGYG